MLRPLTFPFLLLLVLLTACAPVRHYEAALVLQDIAADQGASRLKETTAAPVRQSITYTVDGRERRGDLYVPKNIRAAIVAIPGAVPLGNDDPRLVSFATTLARAGFAVLAPDLRGFRALHIRPADSREISDAFIYLSSRPELAPAGRAGMFAFSYAVGPAVLAALEPDIRAQVRYIIGVGGYHDLPRAMRFFTTGWFEHDGQWQRMTPDDTGKMVLLYASLPYLEDNSDRGIFDRMVALRMTDPAADLNPLAAALSRGAQAAYALAANTDPARFAELLADLPAAMRADMERLNLARYDLKSLQARLILVHGKNDNLIPYPESLALAAAAPQGLTEVFLINRVLGHVDLKFSTLFSWRFWSEDLPDMWKLWRVIDMLLAERQPAPTAP
ncbi:MAG: alpha/beta hydrolase [Gammaproteobacteria bacterium]|nr:alpha/beta hydrolase [Rhodocyclaceae bacterium]MBU3908422.1 alpha/beta hydrolase [Gammaproteobacteria bacterium]MBU3989356.1 alpha/beta hydrolase [Gammaproteobacteria bacterium]MBU4005368.1 alpha/beta hydrolase [Gammaproteobacteria bacterium]MBU4021053.1 alpha/beta hydrolase [Gammaproteobacteria bacterium]